MSKLTPEQKAVIENCAFRSAQPVKRLDCGRGCCNTAMTRVFLCQKHPGDYVTFGLCDAQNKVVAACIYCRMSKTADQLTPDELAELDAWRRQNST